jgi:hypothetical protein
MDTLETYHHLPVHQVNRGADLRQGHLRGCHSLSHRVEDELGLWRWLGLLGWRRRVSSPAEPTDLGQEQVADRRNPPNSAPISGFDGSDAANWELTLALRIAK